MRPIGAGNLFVEHVDHWFAKTSRKSGFPICPIVIVRQLSDQKSRHSYLHFQSGVQITRLRVAHERVSQLETRLPYSWVRYLSRSVVWKK
jgi:hypothetical protein